MYLWTYSTGAIAKMYGMRQTLLQQDIKQQGTGMVFYTVYNFKFSYFVLSLQNLNLLKENSGIVLV